ncbi:hypothetical protein [Methylopila sp. M107]|uniref:hypothetical protein n=1 Tax=Methylopila sp. M107 TaxID=1101190 RepID=UPI0003818C37|nr:hypothetical protein [Methylopila sp. M107]
MAETDHVYFNVDVDARALRAELAEAEKLSRAFGSALGDALESGIVKGGSLSEVLRSLGGRLSSLALQAALKPVEAAFGSIFSGLTRGALGGFGALFSGGGLGTPRTLGGGLLSTASLGVAADRPAPVQKAASVTVNIATPDPESFRRAESQVTASLARAVARGRRGL